MKVWIVLIVPAGGPRYTDTIWASEVQAQSRKQDISEYWSIHGPDCGHKVYVMTGKIEDATIVVPVLPETRHVAKKREKK
jgi:hypothetical protein